MNSGTSCFVESIRADRLSHPSMSASFLASVLICTVLPTKLSQQISRPGFRGRTWRSPPRPCGNDSYIDICEVTIDENRLDEELRGPRDVETSRIPPVRVRQPFRMTTWFSWKA